MPVEDLKERVTASGYWRWMARIEQELNEPKPDHYYMALVASEIAATPYRVWGVKIPDAIGNLKNWLLKFGTPEEIHKKVEERSEEQEKRQAELSKSMWLQFLKLDEDGNYVGDRKTRLPGDRPGTGGVVVGDGETRKEWTPPPVEAPAVMKAPAKKRVQVFKKPKG